MFKFLRYHKYSNQQPSSQPTKTSIEIGANAEQLTLEYLQHGGLKLVTRNYRCRYGEIDLIMKDKNTLVFVEVRYRRHQQWGSGAESVHYYKQRKLITTARHFLQVKPRMARLANRFDVVSIQPQLNKPLQLRFNWIKNAFQIKYNTI